ncbi:MAG: Radical SAM domain protein [Berkelbacteria bacterium GW2011_GWA1_39_10]|uniref:Radical SAM domain protein n=1 Tax=Berkelbacteria bacterium GW2011_GWA1_39_10 TaxID=1618332 RepID=A0A0G0LR34_9BACT|nr:MAG: Radical SAM domain protein [Berkelbacteria bacterium GW2011_GWA1_39_10]
MKECLLYKKSGDYLECQTCNHRCKIAPFRRGICGVRENNRGKLSLLVYGRVIAENIDPIEKKPLYHFMPGTKSLSIATVGCNLRCLWCQNDDISQCTKSDDFDRDAIMNKVGVEMEPEQIVTDAKKQNCPSISYTYTEPTIFLEFALDTMKLAKKEGLKNIWVSNGYMTTETLDLITPYLDAINIDLKGFSEENYLKYSGAKLQPVLDNIRDIYKRKIHIEVTTLIVPGVNDDEKQLDSIAKFLASISKEIPWHISRFFPAYKMMDTPPTPIETLELAESLGKEAGLKYIHLGNI